MRIIQWYSNSSATIISYSLIDIRNYSKNKSIIIIYYFYVFNNLLELINLPIIARLYFLCYFMIRFINFNETCTTCDNQSKSIDLIYKLFIILKGIAMLYLVSAILIALVFVISFIIVRKIANQHAEKLVTRICAVGFVLQIIVNWLFLGAGMVHNPFAEQASVEQTSIAFLILCLVSIFCYGSLLLILYKAHEFYHD